ncbi:D-tagatose-bisphosphate aldolase, class II, non-catalytic subunit [bacterium]|nr:D-tagatose-bisphosphate aldolase, class II, non-catalytic subunit [bacterium]
MNPILKIISSHKQGRPAGIYSVCSSNKFVIEAAMKQAEIDGGNLLIESTSNQVNQFGGYTGMTPAKFVTFVRNIADSMDFDFNRVILGGDHLGPNAWQNERAGDAMAKASGMVREYAVNGFRKIHLDASMRCADDPYPLDEQIVAERAAELCGVVEKALSDNSDTQQLPLYVIGTEVPVPGGAKEALKDVSVTEVEDVQKTIDITKQAFLSRGLESAWERVIAVVVQPGVEFSDTAIVEYDSEKARKLSKFIENEPNLVYEAHSTDYQKKDSLQQMVKDHFAILKVGPWLTFAFREAVFALSFMENEWLSHKKDILLSDIQNVLDKAMQANPVYWQNYYHGDSDEILFAKKYSYSDRVRYYWSDQNVNNALSLLLNNLTENPVPMTLLSQYMPEQYDSVKGGKIANKPVELIQDKIMKVTGIYSEATNLSDY